MRMLLDHKSETEFCTADIIVVFETKRKGYDVARSFMIILSDCREPPTVETAGKHLLPNSISSTCLVTLSSAPMCELSHQ